ncbi:MAG: HDOD domain-containing protein [Phycisphaeraceae bacterium]|nr:MAG: HDOD domain-containing protein [Phycisphaeraceae bacterium]
MRARCQLGPGEVESLYGFLAERLIHAGIETQPEVASKVLTIASDPGAGIGEYARVIRTDAALSGRLLRLANSAHFAQRSPITSVDRACVMLGIERLRSLSLGFYLAKSASRGTSGEFTRRVWGQSLFRACLASELARRLAPALAAEAFVAGIMLDCGVPLMLKMLGPPYEDLLREGLHPPGQFHREWTSLPFTHVDVAAVLAKRWRLPPLLAKPIEWHHEPPVGGAPALQEQQLHRVVYYAGAVDLKDRATPERETAPSPGLASRHLGLAEPELLSVIEKATSEYVAVQGVFAGVCDPLDDPESLAERVHLRMVRVLDDLIERTLASGASPPAERFRLGGYQIEIQGDGIGMAAAYLTDRAGERIACCRVAASENSLALIRLAFSLDPAPDDDHEGIKGQLRRLAA